MLEKKSLENEIQRMEDVYEIQNLMSRYQYLKAASLHHKAAELFALKTPGVRAEVANWGVYEGAEGVKKLFIGIHSFADQDRIGVMSLHTLTTQIIEVADDGKTAKGAWISPGVQTMKADGKLQASWLWCKYGIDFIKEDSQWKFWHFHVYAIFSTPYDKSWVETGEAEPVAASSFFPKELKSDRPTTHQYWEYSPTSVYPADQPWPPEPYKNWDEAKSYVK